MCVQPGAGRGAGGGALRPGGAYTVQLTVQRLLPGGVGPPLSYDLLPPLPAPVGLRNSCGASKQRGICTQRRETARLNATSRATSSHTEKRGTLRGLPSLTSCHGVAWPLRKTRAPTYTSACEGLWYLPLQVSPPSGALFQPISRLCMWVCKGQIARNQ
ncbi:Protein of unknown function [Gryllus bimaculatus]|nr:Protein of unknown function [Gryllus bimaculatus]